MRQWLLRLITVLIFSLVACSANASVSSEQYIIDIVWQALEPNTSSHDQTAWEIVEVRTAKGSEVQELFEGETVPGNCTPGPTPPDNETVANNASYWYVLMKPRLVTSRPQPTEQFSPTAPPNIPEPFFHQALFLVDARTGKVVARKLHCIIY